MLVRFQQFVRRYPALVAAKRVGIAVSGGGDSVALARLASEAQKQFGWSLTLLHVNYGLRGLDSEGDSDFVIELARELGCKVLIERIQPEGRSEEELRLLRYDWFATCPVDAILTGHTLDDQAETVLFRLARGTGPSGLAGVLPYTAEQIYRPLLALRREDLRNWLLSTGKGWREDSSNLDSTYRRNWIRKDLLPLLRRELNPEVDQSLANLAEIAFDESQWLEPLVAKKLDELARPEVDWVVLDCERFRLEALALRRRLLRALIERVKGDLLQIQFTHIEAILRLTEESEGNGRIQVPGLDLMRSFGSMRVIRLQTLAAMPPRNFRVDFPVPGRIEVPEGAGIVVITMDHRCNYNKGGRSLDWNRLFAAPTAEHRLELRNWRPGDSYVRNASTGPEKIKELFQRHRIPLWHRRSWPILVLGDSPVWVAEFGPAVGFAAGPETRTALHVEWKRP